MDSQEPKLNAAFGTFEDEALERAYRSASLREDAFRNQLILGLILVPTVVFAAADIVLFDEAIAYYSVLAARIILVCLTLGCLVTLQKATRFETVDKVMLTWLSVIIPFNLWLNSILPASFHDNWVIDILMILVVYTFLETKLAYRMVAGITFTLGNALVAFFFKEPLGLVEALIFCTAYSLGNVFPLLLARRHNASRRTEYWHQRELELSLERVRKLSGLLPICASCKSIRDDEGYWNSIEKYIDEHSEASFTHGLCPSCITKLYPESEGWEEIAQAPSQKSPN